MEYRKEYLDTVNYIMRRNDCIHVSCRNCPFAMVNNPIGKTYSTYMKNFIEENKANFNYNISNHYRYTACHLYLLQYYDYLESQ